MAKIPPLYIIAAKRVRLYSTMFFSKDMFSPLPGTGSNNLPLLNVLQENRKQYAFFALLQLFFSVYSIF